MVQRLSAPELSSNQRYAHEVNDVDSTGFEQRFESGGPALASVRSFSSRDWDQPKETHMSLVVDVTPFEGWADRMRKGYK